MGNVVNQKQIEMIATDIVICKEYRYCEECGQHLIWEEEQEDDEYFL